MKQVSVKPVDKLSRSAVLWQLIACVAVVLPNVVWLPAWVLLLGAGCIAARVMIHTGRWSFPHWSLRLLLVVAAAAGLLVSFNRDASLNAMVALLTVGLALKLLEIYRRRDALVLLYVALFVAATVFLFEQSLLMAVYMCVAVLAVIAALVSVWQDPLREEMLRPLKLASRMLLPALPLMLVLFFLFPRIGPLWSVELDRSAARTGLSDSMAPGDISRLTRSDELAFRAVFEGEPPAPSLRYWRVLVLSAFDGRSWTVGSSSARGAEVLDVQGETLSYEIVQEPSRQRWLYALDVPLAAPPQAQLTMPRTLVSANEVSQRIQYSLTSAPAYQLATQLSQAERRTYTRLPSGGNPRSRELVNTWLNESQGDVLALLDQMLEYFHASFVYTLEPMALGEHSVDEFLFDTRQGFCEHFASATAFMLRAADIPARVVTGYQGGEWNTTQRYLTLRQYDAHAWVEVWIEGQGWQRLDPTAAVAPERIEMSADQLFSGQAGFLADSPLSARRLIRQGWLLQARMRYDALNFAWQRWVLNYHHQQQSLLQDWLGGVTPWKMVLALLVPGALVLGWLAWRLLRWPQPQDPLQRHLQRLLQRVARQGFQRQPDETLNRFVVRVAAHSPALAEILQPVAEAYESLHYAPSMDTQARQRLLAAMRQAETRLKSSSSNRSHRSISSDLSDTP